MLSHRMGRIGNWQILLMAATLAIGVAADIHVGYVGQLVISSCVFAVLFYLVSLLDPRERGTMLACILWATAGECVLSLVLKLYYYRLENIPLFVPPGHVMMFMLGLKMAERVNEKFARAIFGFAVLYTIVMATLQIDTLGIVLLILMSISWFSMPQKRTLFASTFVLSLCLEFYGTWLGDWTWVKQETFAPLVATNPPIMSSALYSTLDALVTVTMVAFTRTVVMERSTGVSPVSET